MHGIFFNDFDLIGHIISEAYVGKVYDSFLSKDMTILEVGGNVGAVTLYLSRFAKSLYVMEPSTQHLEVLHKTVEYNKLDNVTIIPKALDAVDGERTFYENDKNNTMFSLKQTFPVSKEETVQCASLSSILDEYNIDCVDFMKLDVEGSEIDILTSESFRKESGRIKSLLIEYHTWAGDRSELEKALTQNNYRWWTVGSPINSTLYGVRKKIPGAADFGNMLKDI